MIYPRKIKGFRDIDENLNKVRWHIIEKAIEIYKKYGFEHWDTPILEYSETIGKYLPETQETLEGVYSFKNPELEPVYDPKGIEIRDENQNVLMTNHFITLRYDLTAPLARLYSEMLWQKYINNQLTIENADLFRRYQFGPVFRYEAKLDPGRFREFWQLDFDTVGSNSVIVDAENCIILAEALENIGISKKDFIVKVNNRKILKGFLQSNNVNASVENDILRIIDKLDKIGLDGVLQELGQGRTDTKSGAFIKGLNLDKKLIDSIQNFIAEFSQKNDRKTTLAKLYNIKLQNQIYNEGLKELELMHEVFEKNNLLSESIIFDPSLVRGMGYYTGPIYEVEYLLTLTDSKGQERKFGSICGGGRYDNLVENLIGVKIPASGASIGVDRLAEIIAQTGNFPIFKNNSIFIINFGEQFMPYYQELAQKLRKEDFIVEIYYGNKASLKQQLAYADKKNYHFAFFIGEDEINKKTISVRNLKLGRILAPKITDKKEWTDMVQREIPADLIVNFMKYQKFEL